MTNNTSYGAVIKWAGGKSKLAPVIEEKILENVSIDKIDTYVEPFLGGGSFFFHMVQKYNFKNIVISDINEELINLYKVIQKKPKKLMESAAELQDKYNSLSDLEEKSEFYYLVRNEYNESIMNELKDEFDVEQAVSFLFLNKVGFNGLYRVNLKGKFNVPFGKREKASLFKEDNILGVSELLQGVTIQHSNYDETLEYVDNKTLVYFDPPYRPLSTSSSFTSYAKSDFNDDSQIKLADYCKKIDKLGAKFALSNSDPKNSSLDDNFFDELYKEFSISRVYAKRMIGAKTASRGKVSEILVTN
ncbi:Dam family site-specific DNA-(adenine-N6)-methyltransferase [Vagococcus fluvialis]|uniref:DNA adenine methylase n=1 Tax=Vagococcus fluvialis TaxID=2738 RepID=UPI0014333890|nr:Dam family site-specific DNA-(adenine-N6)-methyltransferase [Vagococcus fluvialis]NKC59422.1 Dam family site-specific DNA-(adenine-N6)-methyltransferase [Vagococcus fluvialis]NKD50182.1 Dam family site-specific DNA-(adenine-N6)-methyltransferase [Vagococcus fluvialis]